MIFPSIIEHVVYDILIFWYPTVALHTKYEHRVRLLGTIIQGRINPAIFRSSSLHEAYVSRIRHSPKGRHTELLHHYCWLDGRPWWINLFKIHDFLSTHLCPWYSHPSLHATVENSTTREIPTCCGVVGLSLEKCCKMTYNVHGIVLLCVNETHKSLI